MSDGSDNREQDALAKHSKGIATGLASVAVLLLVTSVSTDVHGDLPAIALGWTLGIDLVRAAVAFAAIALVTILLVRGWSGDWPQRVSTSSIAWEKRLVEGSVEFLEGATKLQEASQKLEALESAKGSN